MSNVSIYDSDLMIKVAAYLNNVENPDHIETEGYSVSPETVPVKNIKDEEKIKLYAKKKFEDFLKDYLQQKFNKKEEKLSKEFCEKIYRGTYAKYYENNPSTTSYMRVMYHPDATVADYAYIAEKIGNFNKNILRGEAALFIALGLIYYKSPFRKTLKSNPALTGLMFGVTPAVGYLCINYGNQWLLDRRVRNLGLLDKYQIK